MLPVVLVVIAALVCLWALASVAGLLFWLVPWIILGLIAGWVASRLVGSPYGIGGNILIGIAGSVIGGAIFSLFFHIHTGGGLSPSHLLVSIIGSIVLLAAMRAFGRPVYR